MVILTLVGRERAENGRSYLVQQELSGQQRSCEQRLWAGAGSVSVGHVARIAGCRKLDTEYGQSTSNINSSCAWPVLFVLGFLL